MHLFRESNESTLQQHTDIMINQNPISPLYTDTLALHSPPGFVWQLSRAGAETLWCFSHS